MKIGEGFCIKLDYLGYEVSLADDGSNTCVFDKYGKALFEVQGAGVVSICEAREFLDRFTMGKDLSQDYILDGLCYLPRGE